ncbi:MAG: response regulator transcription factor [Sedimentisphaerales bacterium]|nr:response regulator transcription factor [Sedimentisphaerales bacterium]
MEGKKTSISILLADDHKIIRDGLRALIEKQSDMEVVADADNGRSAVELATKLRPAVVVMDVSMPDLNGIEATRQILSLLPDTKIIALSMHSDRRFVTEMFKANACGYLLKDCAFEELIRAIETVVSNHTYLSPGIADLIVEDFVHKPTGEQASVFSLLTNREREVLQLLAEGNTTKQIATECHVSVKTIETHRQHIMEKLSIHSVAELTKYAIREGLTSLDR